MQLFLLDSSFVMWLLLITKHAAAPVRLLRLVLRLLLSLRLLYSLHLGYMTQKVQWTPATKVHWRLRSGPTTNM